MYQPEPRTCTVCGRSFVPIRNQNVFCSKLCRLNHYALVHHLPTPGSPLLSTAATGALHELAVASDLMQRGLFVFRGLSSAGPCDLIAMNREGGVWRIEVTTGVPCKTHLTWPAKKERAHYCFDVLAVVTHSGDITYTTDKIAHKGVAPTPWMAIQA